jgi:hypothetical protein
MNAAFVAPADLEEREALVDDGGLNLRLVEVP